ncbi:MAG: hypothetical protein JWN93_3538 [Hyphomicrobiales bacterium]|nr:hypothetical protein [Hyphomicrobiales bacterium]
MRRPLRPFTVEKKQGSRPAEKTASTPAALPVFADLLEDPAPRKSAHRDPNLAAAEALFSRPAAAESDAADARRILPSLEELPPTPLEQLLAEEPKRRGRKPGSRNKPKALGEESAAEPRKRGRKPGSKNKPRTAPGLEPEFMDNFVVEPAPATFAPLTSLRRLGRIPRAELPRGERWKARLPRFAR